MLAPGDCICTGESPSDVEMEIVLRYPVIYRHMTYI